MARTTFFNFLATCLISSSLPATIAHASAIHAAHLDLFVRANSECVTSNYSPCNIGSLPANFCCPSAQKCIAFNDDKSAICCPAGQDCKTIAPLSCDISKQNATLSPASQLHSTDLTGTLATCGSQCCPKGYTCQNGNCAMAASSSSSSTLASQASSSASGSASTSKPTSTTAEGAKSTSTSTPSSSPQNSTSTTPHNNNFAAPGILVGLLVGLLAGAAITIAIICICGRRRVKAAKKSSGGSVFSSPTAAISDPIYQNDHPRTDFLRREPRPTDAGNTAPRRTSRVRSLFSRSPTLPRHDEGFSAQNTRGGLGKGFQTPKRTSTLRREPSMESIKIYSPPSMTVNEPRQTTFGDMMKQAGFKPGQPYLGSPGRVRNAHSPTSVYSRGFWDKV